MEPILDPEMRELEESLMKAGRDVAMTDAMRAQTLAALGLGTATVATTAASGTASLAKGGAVGWLAGKAGAMTAVAVVVVSSAVGVVALRSSRAPDPVVSSRDALSKPSGVAEETKKTADLQTEVTEKLVEPGGQPTPPVTAGERRVVPSRAAPEGDLRTTSLSDELRAISEAETFLKKGQASAALAALDAYRRRFPHPQMGLEVEVMTIQALAESGASAAAQKRAVRFVQRYPKSPLSARVKRYAE